MNSNIPLVSNFEGGTLSIDLDDAWTIIDNEQFHYIIHPYYDAANLKSIEDELEDRFDPMEDLQGIGFTAYKAAFATCGTLGNTRNSPHNSITGIDDTPTDPAELAAAYGAICAKELNNDPARPLHYLVLKNVLPPPAASRFTRLERDTLLYDGIATTRVDANNNVVIDRAITTYQKNSTGTADASYLDVTTLATISEIRYQFKTRMMNRYIATRTKLASNSFPVQPGTNVVTPNTLKGSIIALFMELRDAGLIENVEEFVENLVVERDETDVSRVNVLLPPDV
jgi:phage tail sheath gpL-like